MKENYSLIVSGKYIEKDKEKKTEKKMKNMKKINTPNAVLFSMSFL